MAQDNSIRINKTETGYSVEHDNKKVAFNDLRAASLYLDALQDFHEESKKPGGIKSGRCKTCILDCCCHICKANDYCYIASLDPCPHIKACPNFNKGYRKK